MKLRFHLSTLIVMVLVLAVALKLGVSHYQDYQRKQLRLRSITERNMQINAACAYLIPKLEVALGQPRFSLKWIQNNADKTDKHLRREQFFIFRQNESIVGAIFTFKYDDLGASPLTISPESSGGSNTDQAVEILKEYAKTNHLNFRFE